MLATSGHFPANVTTDARDLWLRTGRAACELLEQNNGDVVATRFDVGETLVDYQGAGWSEEGLTERLVTVVDAASLYLCSEWSTP